MNGGAPRIAPVARAWPVQLALGVVVALVATMVGADLVIAQRVALRTAQIVGNTQRSVELLEDLHTAAYRLFRIERNPEGLPQVERDLSALEREYDRVADDLGERAEWDQLHSLLDKLVSSARSGAFDTLRDRSDEVDQRIDRLIAINREAARANAAEIRNAHHSALLTDGTIGAVVLGLCVAVALVLRRVLSRQRELAAAHIALLDERNRELDQFAGRAAHDLRAPLSPIRGYADLLALRVESPDEVQRMASRIRAAVDKMSRVVDDMLELSRAGRPLPGRASPRAAATEVLDELEVELREAEVEVALPDGDVACAPGVLQQILRNLVQNAVKFRSRERPLQIRISGRTVDGAIELSIEDNGVGMDTELAIHAFEAGYRGRTDREVPGHGLGLAIVDRTTHALGGSIAVRSAPDQGCTISITLPAA